MKTVIIQNGKEIKKIPTPSDPLRLVEEEMKDIRYLGFEDETDFLVVQLGMFLMNTLIEWSRACLSLIRTSLSYHFSLFMMADLVHCF